MRLVWNTEGKSAALDMRRELNVGIKEATIIFKQGKLNIAQLTDEQALKMIDILDKAGCSPELKD